MNWCSIDTAYLNYLREEEHHIPFSDYGSNKYKPFFRKLFDLNDEIEYVACVSHTKPKYAHYKNKMGFRKIYLKSRNGNQFLAGAVLLNDMFPVPKKLITNVKGGNISDFRNFYDDKEKSKYISFLRRQRQAMEKMNLQDRAKKLYNLYMRNPNASAVRNCFNYAKLNELAKKY